MAKAYAFFAGLDSDGVETTLEEYTTGDALAAGWRVHTLLPHTGSLATYYDLLLEREQYVRPDPPPRPAPLPNPAHTRRK